MHTIRADVPHPWRGVLLRVGRRVDVGDVTLPRRTREVKAGILLTRQREH